MKRMHRLLAGLLAAACLICLSEGLAYASGDLDAAFYNDVDGDGDKELVPLIFRGKTTITREYFYTQNNAVPYDAALYNGPTPEDDEKWDALYCNIWDTYGIDPYDEYETLGKEAFGEDSDEYRALCRDCEEFLAFDEEYSAIWQASYDLWQIDKNSFLKTHPEITFGHTVNPRLTTVTETEEDTLLYWLHVPFDYDPAKKYPVFVYAHGEDMSLRTSKYLNADGTLNVTTLSPFWDSGFNTIFGKWYSLVKNPGANREKFDCFIIYIINTNEFFRGTSNSIAIVNQYNDYDTPDAYVLTAEDTGDSTYKASYSRLYDASKLSPGYQEQLVCQLIDSLAEEYSVDLSRQYVAGFSLGGILTMDIISHYPDRFACAVPICSASADISEENVKELTYTNVWAFAGNGDGTCNKYFSKLFVEAINQARDKYGTGLSHTAQYSFFAGGHSGGHAKCSAATAVSGVSTTGDMDLLNFIFSSVRETPQTVPRVFSQTNADGSALRIGAAFADTANAKSVGFVLTKDGAEIASSDLESATWQCVVPGENSVWVATVKGQRVYKVVCHLVFKALMAEGELVTAESLGGQCIATFTITGLGGEKREKLSLRVRTFAETAAGTVYSDAFGVP